MARTRHGIVIFLATSSLLLLSHPASASESGALGDFDTLRDVAKKDGSVGIVVELNTDFVPEGELSTGGVKRQRSDISSDQREVESDVGETAARKYKTVPFITIDADLADLDALEHSDLVESVAQDLLVKTSLSDSTPLVDADLATNAGFDGAGTTVAIVDTGVQASHPFLSGKVVEGACYAIGASYGGAGNCPNGLDSDTSVGAGEPCTFAPTDCTHGTHVAGIAVGSGASFDGVAPGANIYSVQVFSAVTCGSSTCAGAWSSDIVAGLDRIYARRTAYNFASVNMSLGGATSYSGYCDSANSAATSVISNLRSAGIATTIAAGNSGWTNGMSWPACISSAVSVGSTTKTDDVAYYSNASPVTAILAPGSSIYSSVPGSTYSTKSGTSMAAPQVAGAFAALKDAFPSASISDLLTRLQATGFAIVDPGNGLTYKRINVKSAIDATPPTAPGTPNAAPGNAKATVSWAGSSSGGLPITYTVEGSNGATMTTTSTSIRFTGLTNGTSYRFRVSATSAFGNSGATGWSNWVVPDPAAGPPGYWLYASNGAIATYGEAVDLGASGLNLASPVVDGAPTPTRQGSWLVAADGGIFSFGDAAFYGSTGNLRLTQPIVGMAPTPSGRGYWLVASDGGIFSFGDAQFYGSTGNLRITQPIVGMAPTPTGRGYWLVASDGGIFSFGDATFFGSTGALRLFRPIVGMAPSPTGRGYWLVASDGGIFSFGDATFYGSTGNLRLAQPISGMVPTSSGRGYYLTANDGGIFTYGDAQFAGSGASTGWRFVGAGL